jgi:non-ribosomal peptide synthetase component E (peptide arylation enzyme)
MPTRKAPTELLAEVTAILSLTAAKPDVEDLRDLLINAFYSWRGAILYSEVDALITGDNSVKSIATTALGEGDLIVVVVDNIPFFYNLVEAVMDADVSPYIIKPTDYHADDNAKYWRLSNCKYYEFDNDDLDGNHEYFIKTYFGVKYVKALLFNNSDLITPLVLAAALSGETNAAFTAVDADNCKLTFAGAITGTWKVILSI